jgi:LmbE family N-acetylglucosaminyl deacetylase
MVVLRKVVKKPLVIITLFILTLISIGFIYFSVEENAAEESAIEESTSLKNDNNGNNKRNILIVSPHEDDETIACAGVIKTAVENGDDVRLLLVTNGDYKGKPEERIKESIAAMDRLGLKKDKIYYLGYGDWNVINELYYQKNTPSNIKDSTTGNSQTFGFPGIIDDYRYLLSGTHSTNCRNNVLSDIESVIATFKPAQIYLPSAFEMHPDHKATALFVTEAILDIKKKEDYSPILHEYLIYKAGLPQSDHNFDLAPVPYSDVNAHTDFTSPYLWEARESVIVPHEMSDSQSNEKKVDLLNAGVQIEADGILGKNNDLIKAFDGNKSTFYTSSGADDSMSITVTFVNPIVIEKIRTLITGASTDITLEAADNNTDLNNKTKSYRKLADNSESTGDWNKIETVDAYNSLIWKFTFHQKTPGKKVSISEIEFINSNLKAATIGEYDSQATGVYEKYVMKDEIFWKRDMSSLSYNATVSASSENAALKQYCSNVIDGVILGDGIFKTRNDAYIKDVTRSKDDYQNIGNREFEWAANGQTTGAWIKLSWEKSISANRIILYDRPDLDENILKAKLTFSDKSTLDVGPLNKNGGAYVINFNTKKFKWVKLTVQQAEGTNTGLAEFEVFND